MVSDNSKHFIQTFCNKLVFLIQKVKKASEGNINYDRTET